MKNLPNDPDAREVEAKRILDRVAEESETVGASSMKRVADRIGGHIGASDADQEKWSEVWGTRIGRVLGLIFFIGLLIYMIRVYVFNG